MSYETCFLCDSETGRAGAGDDSIYDELGKGPYCIECYNRQIPARLRALNELSLTDDAAEEIDILRARVAELEAGNALLRHDCAKAEVDIAERDLVIDALEAQIAAQESVVHSALSASAVVNYIDDLMKESRGVYGFHLNGAPCPWDYFDDLRSLIDEAMDAKLPNRSGERK